MIYNCRLYTSFKNILNTKGRSFKTFFATINKFNHKILSKLSKKIKNPYRSFPSTFNFEKFTTFGLDTKKCIRLSTGVLFF